MLHIYYGSGKGKTSAALGLIIRAAGYKKRIVFMQFLKPKNIISGEQISLKRLKNVAHIQFDQTHPFFVKNDRNKKKKLEYLRQNIDRSIAILKQTIQRKCFDVLICDEILNLVNSNLLSEKELIKIVRPIKDTKEIILTGRLTKPKKLLAIADYATKMSFIKHPFRKGINARKGIEY